MLTRCWRKLRARLVGGVTPLQLIFATVLLVASDWAYQRAGDSFVPGGPLDETAHLMTALLILEALPRPARARFLGPALIGSVAIDLDHIPQYLGYRFLTVGTPRPYTHSLLTLVVFLTAAAVWRRRRDLLAGLALGMTLHFFRDLAERNGSGISLLWPFSDHPYSYSHRTYVIIMIVVVLIVAIKTAVARTRASNPVPLASRPPS